MATPVAILDQGDEARDVADVERQLANLRRRADAAAREAMAPTARAAVLNVIVYATRRIHAERAARTIAELGERHPSRAIVLFQDPEAPDRLILTCHQLAGRDRQVRYEQIVVRTRTESPYQLRSIVIPLLNADLPVFLWWTGTPVVSSPLFRALAGVARRLIVDSADFARPERTLPDLLSLVQDDRAYAVTDLNWARLTPWRELLAQFFDVPEWRPFLDAITGVRIGFAVDMDGREIHPSQAFLLIGWLAARLGWHPVERLAPSEAGGHLFRMSRADGGSIWMRVRPRFFGGVDEGDVTGVRVLADRDGRHAEFVVKRMDDHAFDADVQVLIDGVMTVQRRVRLPAQAVATLLGEELAITRSDVVYESALDALLAFSGRTR